MQVFAHGGIGWVLAEAGRGDRRFRQFVLLSAVFPDLDGLSLLLGMEAYGTYHDRLTHSEPLALLLSTLAAILCHRCRFRAFLFTQLGFWSHIAGDYFFSGWPIALWFPFSRVEILNPGALTLDHPVNHVLSLVALATLFWLGRRLRRTPFEALSSALDQRVRRLLFEPRTATCRHCARPANESCERCGQPLCPRHIPMNRRFAVVCAACRNDPSQAANPSGRGPAGGGCKFKHGKLESRRSVL